MKSTRNNAGSAIVAAIVYATILGLLLASALAFGLTERRLNKQHALMIQARYAAQSVLEHGMGDLRQRISQRSIVSGDMLLSATNQPKLSDALIASLTSGTNIVPSSLKIFAGKFSTAVPTAITDPADPLFGSTVDRSTAEIFATATATDPSGHYSSTVRCSSSIEIRYLKWMQDLGDYMPTCEIAPGENTTFDGTFRFNGDLWVQINSGKTLSFKQKVLCAGGMYHGRMNYTNAGYTNMDTGTVNFYNSAKSKDVSMLDAGTWVDQTLSNFADKASELWGNNVMTSAHGIEKLPPPAFEPYVPDNPTTTDVNERCNGAHKLIEPAILNNATGKDSNGNPLYQEDIEVQKLSVSSGLVISIDTGGNISVYKYTKDAGGKYTRLVDETTDKFKREAVTLPSSSIITKTTMYDQRIGLTTQDAMTIYDIDIAKLKAALTATETAKKIGNFDIAKDWNGKIFVEVANPAKRGVRVSNGSSLPSVGATKGLTLGTNTQLYIKGDYNADGTIQSSMSTPDTGEVPAALVADAITILSSNWSDTKSKNALSGRNAPKTTEVSAAFVCGLTATTSGEYSGGFQNLPRFLENWTSSTTFGYRGAMTVLFECEVAPGWYAPGSYGVPTRNWAYNSSFKTNPPPEILSNRRSMSQLGYQEFGSEAAFQAAIAAAKT